MRPCFGGETVKKAFLFATDINPLKMSSQLYEAAVEKISSLPGMIAVHPDISYVLIAFDTLENAIMARGIWTESGYNAGRYIMNGRIEDNGLTLTVISPAYDTSGGPVQ